MVFDWQVSGCLVLLLFQDEPIAHCHDVPRNIPNQSIVIDLNASKIAWRRGGTIVKSGVAIEQSRKTFAETPLNPG
jgi:hypothetical protein